MTTTNYQDDILLWKTERVLNLADHFHEYFEEDNSFQHKRVHRFEMANEHVNVFTKLETIEKLKICLAIHSVTNMENSFRFYPILAVECAGSTETQHFPLDPVALSGPTPQSQFVPEIFKNMIHDNWNKLDIAYIDDLFIAQARDQEGKILDQMVRVHEFILNTEMIEFINSINIDVKVNTNSQEMQPNIQNITMYPGVDMNKFGKTELISFTPVLGFSHLNDPKETLSKHGVLEATTKETFIEYSRPCPPTCHDLKG